MFLSVFKGQYEYAKQFVKYNGCGDRTARRIDIDFLIQLAS